MSSLFSFVDVSLGYGRDSILENINFEMKEGELFFFLGGNGSGKSTFVKALLGLVNPTSGYVNLNFSKENVGYVPQKFSNQINLPMTVEEFVSLGFNGCSLLTQKEKEERLDWALECMSLQGLKHHDCQNLSGGQFQKLLVSRALVRKPRFLIADEPTDAMDRSSTEVFIATIFELNQKYGMAIIFITHDYLLIDKYSRNIVEFKDKKIQVIHRESVS